VLPLLLKDFKKKNMAIMKVIEVLANSEKSWEDATKKAVKQASKSVKNIKAVFVQSQSAVVNGDEISEFRVNLKITFEIN
jgi:flavin-binding protein dodecin